MSVAVPATALSVPMLDSGPPPVGATPVIVKSKSLSAYEVAPVTVFVAKPAVAVSTVSGWYANELEIEAAVSTVAVRPPFPSSATSTSTVLGEVSSVQRASSTVGATS